MLDVRWKRVGSEVALAAFGMPIDGVDPWVLDRLTELLDEQHIRMGEVLWSVGQQVDTLYFMHEGTVRATRKDAPPWTFEGRWLLGGFEGHLERPASRAFTALTDFYALKIRRREWLDLLEDSFELTRRAVASQAATVANLDQRIPLFEETGKRGAAQLSSSEPLTMVERIAFLIELGIGQGAGVQALADVAATCAEVTLRQGEVLFREGGARDRFFLVVDGGIEATRRSPGVARHYGAGEIVTGAAALSSQANAWTAIALGPSRLLAVPIEAWFDLMEEHFDLVHSTMAVFASEREKILDRLAADAGPEGLVLR